MKLIWSILAVLIIIGGIYIYQANKREKDKGAKNQSMTLEKQISPDKPPIMPVIKGEN